MGNFFTPDVDVQGHGLQSKAQEAVQQPLSDVFQQLLGGQFGLGGAEDLFEENFLAPALRGFEQRTLPALQGQFANIGGTLSSRRSQTIADSLVDVQAASQQQYGQLLPSLLGHQNQILGLASQFSLDKSQENVVIQEPSLAAKISGAISLANQGPQQGANTVGALKG